MPKDQQSEGPSSAPKPTPAAVRRFPVWQESLLLLALAIVLALVVKTFVVQAFYIPSGSMQPGLEINDRILVQKISYLGSGEPERGDIVVFEDPGDWLDPAEATGPTNLVTDVMSRIGLYPSGGHLVKRVIGVAGDTIECCDEEGRLLVNGESLDSSGFTLNRGRCDGPMLPSCHWTAGPVPYGTVFVMGDHRDNSADSSYHLRCGEREDDGCADSDAYVSLDLVVGKVFARVWPADRFRIIKRPDAFRTLN